MHGTKPFRGYRLSALCQYLYTGFDDWVITFGTVSLSAGPALGMFDVFGRTGPPILVGPPFWTLKNFRINYKLRWHLS